jgi:hypothetical protein
MNTYIAFYKGRKATVIAETSYKAQQEAATFFKAKKAYDVTIMLHKVEDRTIEHSGAEL